MIKVFYIEYPEMTEENQTGYKDPACIFDFEDIEGGIRVNLNFPELVDIETVEITDEETGDIVSEIKRNVLCPSYTRYYDVIFEEYKGKIMELRKNFIKEPCGIFITEKFNRQSVNEYQQDGFRSGGSEPILVFSINEDASEIIFFLRIATYKPEYENAEYIDYEYEYEKSFAYRMSNASDFVKDKVERYYEKRKNVIEDVDIYNTVTYLEAQVDALTRLVIRLASDKYSNTDEMQILKEADKYSVLDIKTISNMVQEFKGDKGNVRKRQTNLYTAVDENDNAEIGE